MAPSKSSPSKSTSPVTDETAAVQHTAELLSLWFEKHPAFLLTLTGPGAKHNGTRCLSHGLFEVIARHGQADPMFPLIFLRPDDSTESIRSQLSQQGYSNVSVAMVSQAEADADPRIEILVSQDKFTDPKSTGKLMGSRKSKAARHSRVHELELDRSLARVQVKFVPHRRRYGQLKLERGAGIAQGSFSHFKTGTKKLGIDVLKRVLPHLEGEGDRSELVYAWLRDQFESDAETDAILLAIVVAKVEKKNPAIAEVLRNLK